jgi:hypothetical protein
MDLKKNHLHYTNFFTQNQYLSNLFLRFFEKNHLIPHSAMCHAFSWLTLRLAPTGRDIPSPGQAIRRIVPPWVGMKKDLEP